MSLYIKFLKDPKGVFNVNAEVGEERFVHRPLALRLLRDGFAALVPPPGSAAARQYETEALAPGETAVVEPTLAKPWPKKKGRPKNKQKPEDGSQETEENKKVTTELPAADEIQEAEGSVTGAAPEMPVEEPSKE